jgi:S1-C subfamily serine protease
MASCSLVRAGVLAALLCGALAGSSVAAENDAQKLFETVGKSVVTIKTENGKTENGKPGSGKTGSGFILDKTSVVTNYHVISGAEKAEVVFYDKTRVEVTGFWEVTRECDIAILSVKVPFDVSAIPAKLADELPKPGEKVYAFGAPLALSGSISDGIVSAVRLAKELESARTLGYEPESVWIQTTAPISPGNSGGPLFNADGEVLGLATWTDKRGQNINFATSALKITKYVDAWTFVGKQEKKLADLPKPLTATAAGSGNANATLAFWNQWAKLRTKARPAHKAAEPKTHAAKIALHERIARGYNDFAGAVTNLKTQDVDAGLLEIVTKDAAIHRRLGEAWSRSTTAIRNNDVRAMQRDAQEIDAIQRQLTESDNALTQVRVALSKAHGIEFPSFYQSADDRKNLSGDKAAEPAKELKRAKLLIDAGKKDEAKAILQKLQEKYPSTAEADEAARLIKSLWPELQLERAGVTQAAQSFHAGVDIIRGIMLSCKS